jgi:hypothetical protein
MINGHRAWNLTQDDCRYHDRDSWSAIRGTTSSTRPSTDHEDRHNVMQFVSPGVFASNLGCHSAEPLACTIVRYEDGPWNHPQAKYIYDTDILFDAEQDWYSGALQSKCTGAYDVWAVAAHEVGHMLGLDDNTFFNDGSIMVEHQRDYCGGEFRTLAKGDVGGMRHLYPR